MNDFDYWTDDIETWRAMQGLPYEPSVDDPCVDKECKHNSFTGCTKKGGCVHFSKKADKKKLLEKMKNLGGHR